MAPASSKEAVLNLGAMAATVVALNSLFTRMAGGDSYLYDFFWLFAWRYLRFFVNFIAFWCYSPSPKPKGEPTYLPSRDVTVVIPTVDPMGAAFLDCLTSCAANQPAKIVIITAGEDLYAKTLAQVRRVRDQFKATQFVVDRTQVASKRAQVAHAVPHVETDITVLLDDHVFWKPQFLASVLCPFEKPNVGLVGTNKVVRRLEGLTVWRRIWNMIGATYLCRHNFEIRATNTVDGGVFVISGRTCAIRTCILKHPEFLPGYNNEMFFFGLLGPIKPDDDNYITRFVVRHGWDIKIQYMDDSLMETVIGVEDPLVKKYLGQCKRQPYCVYAVYLTSLTNFAAIIDPLLIYLFTHSSAYVSAKSLACLVGWILLTKVPKIFAYFRQHPQDIWLFPVYVLFAYFHSFIKLWALLTFYDCGWSGRQLNDIKVNP